MVAADSGAVGKTGVHFTTSPGVPTYWADLGLPFSATLTFRVGAADETLLESGITHLVEHLAMVDVAVSRRRLQADGATTPTETWFAGSGERDRVLDMLSRVATRLNRLPRDRFHRELHILGIETSGHVPSAWDHLATRRFGARSLGLGHHPCVGLYRLTPDDADRWALRWFNSSNAVLTMTGEPPDDWRLDLPPGSHRPLPEPETEPARYPAVLWHPHDLVCLSFIGPVGPALGAGVDILERRLFDELRAHRGRSYGVTCDYTMFSPTRVLVTVIADCSRGSARGVVSQLVHAFDELARFGPSAGELGDAVSDRLEVLRGNDPPAALAMLADTHLRTGHEPDVAAMEIERGSLTAQAIAVAFTAARTRLLLLMPESAGAAPADFEPLPVLGGPLPGTAFRAIQQPGRLVIGDEGVAISPDDNCYLSVPWQRCGAVLRWPGGKRWIIGTDGLSFDFPARAFRGGVDAISLLDDLTPDAVVVHMPPTTFPNGGIVEVDRDGFRQPVAIDPERDGWALADLARRAGEELPELAPEYDLCLYEKDDIVEVIVVGHDGARARTATERVELRVVDVDDDFSVGRATRPSEIADRIGAGTHVIFEPHHVASVMRLIPEPLWQRLSRRVFGSS